MGVGILAKRVVLELGSSTNFVYSLNWGRGIFKNPPAPIQTVDKVPGLHRGFSIVVINILMILPVFIKKNPLLINSKVKRCALCTWYNYPIRRARL